MPCLDRFAEQDEAYRDSVLPPRSRARVAVEAASPLGWHRWVGDDGDVVAMEGFGASAPAKVLYEHFGFTGEAVAERARAVVERAGRDARFEMSVTEVNERLAALDRGRHQHLARPDPPQHDLERRAPAAWSRRTRCAA